MALPAQDGSPLRVRLRVVVILLLAVVAASVMGNRGLFRLYQMHRDKAALEREIEALAAVNAKLAEEVRAIRTDPGRIEALAREELGLVKPGELVYEFRPTTRPAPPAEAR